MLSKGGETSTDSHPAVPNTTGGIELSVLASEEQAPRHTTGWQQTTIETAFTFLMTASFHTR